MVYLEATINMRVTPVQVVVVRNLSPFQIMLMSLIMSCIDYYLYNGDVQVSFQTP